MRGYNLLIIHMFVLFVASPLLADGEAPEDTHHRQVIDRVNRAEGKKLSSMNQGVLGAGEGTKPPSESEREDTATTEGDQDEAVPANQIDQIHRYLDEVETRRAKALSDRIRRLNHVSAAANTPYSGLSKRYPYQEDKVYDIHLMMGFQTTIKLGPGEEIESASIALDDLFSLHKGSMVTSRGRVHTITLRPLIESHVTDFIITTTKRTYYINLIIGDMHMPFVEWSYPGESWKKVAAQLKKEEKEREKRKKAKGQSEDEYLVSLEDLSPPYIIDGDDDILWKPTKVHDDGKKTIIRFPDIVKHTDAPAFYALEDDNEVRIPGRALFTDKGEWTGYYTFDRIVVEGEFRLDEKTVSVTNPTYNEPSFWEWLF